MITVHMKDGELGNFRQMYYPQNFDAHPSFIRPTALQPGAIVAYKLETRIRDVWVLTVALNSCRAASLENMRCAAIGWQEG